MHDQQLQHDAHEILDEHEHLRRVLREIETTLVERQARPAVVIGFIEDFSHHVLSHFQHEEEDGYFADLVEVAPRLSGQIQRLRVQHDQFRESLASMRQLAQQHIRSDDWWDNLAAQFHEFTQRFLAHEHAENGLFQETYGRDIGAED